jgi:hypothetical protein
MRKKNKVGEKVIKELFVVNKEIKKLLYLILVSDLKPL